MISAYLIHLSILVEIYVILAMSLQLAMGFGGLLNIGHVAFYGIGAYISAILALSGVSFWVCLAGAGMGAAVCGWLLALPTNKLRGDYLALVTLGFYFIFHAVILNWTDMTRGLLGLPGIPKPVLFGFVFSENARYLILTSVIAFCSYLGLKKLVSSPYGRAIQAVRDDELAAKVLGKNTFLLKSSVLAASAFLAGLAGSLYAHYITFLDPSSFVLSQISPVISMVVIGGLASLEGAVLAAVILTLLPEPLRFIGFPPSILGPMQQIIYALLLLGILIYNPKGLMGRAVLE